MCMSVYLQPYQSSFGESMCMSVYLQPYQSSFGESMCMSVYLQPCQSSFGESMCMSVISEFVCPAAPISTRKVQARKRKPTSLCAPGVCVGHV